jgi:surface antigen
MSTVFEAPSNQVVEYEEQTHWRELLHTARRMIGRYALAVSLMVGGGSVMGVGEDLAEQHVAAAATGGYPDADAVDCSASYGVYSWCKNNWWLSGRGYAYRNCTDWAAFRETQLTGVAVPHDLGNANTWDDNARNHSFTVDTVPEPGDVSQVDGGSFGHVGTIEGVSRDSQGRVTAITVSEYNLAGTGEYSQATYAADANGIFWRDSTHTRKWDHFIDFNGTGKGIAGSNTNSASTKSTPAAVPRGTTTMDVFYRDTSGRLINTGWNARTGWNGTRALANSGVASSPTAVARGSTNMDVFYRDSNNNLENVGWNAADGWYAPRLRVSDGTLRGDPIVIDRSPDSMDVFYRNANGNLINIGWTALKGWAAPKTLVGDGSVSGDPVAVARSETAMSVFYRDKNNNVVEEGWDANVGWMQPQVRASGAAGDFATMSGNSTSMSVFFRTTGGALGQAYWSASQGWHHNILVNSGVATDPTVAKRSKDDVDVFYGDGSGHLMNDGWNVNRGWSGPHSRASGVTDNPFAIARSVDDMDVFYRDGDAHLDDAGWSVNTGWMMTKPTGASSMS